MPHRTPVSGERRAARPHPAPLLALLLFAGTLPAHALEPAPSADPFTAAIPFVKPYRDAEGLPQNTVHALALDREGLLWVGTQDGVARYDGRRWEGVQLPVARRTRYVRCLFVDRAGALWFGTQGAGLLRLNGEGWRVFSPSPGGQPGERVNAIAETEVGGRRQLWVALHDEGVAAFDGSAWRRWTTAEGLPADRVWDLLPPASAGDDSLWIATSEGLARLRVASGRVERLPGAPAVSFSSLARTRDPAGREILWAGSYGEGLYRFAGGTWTRFGRAEGLRSTFLTDLEPRPEGRDGIWIATDGGGIAELAGDRVHALDLGPLFDSGAAYRLLATTDAQGAAALWVGTRNNGLLRVSEGLWRAVHPVAEAPAATVSALLVRADGGGGVELWAGLDGRGLALWRQGTWRRFDRASGALANDTVLALAETRQVGPGPRVWAGTRNGGLASWDGSRWSRFDRAGGALPHDLVQALLEVPEPGGTNRLWVGTRGGAVTFDGRRWQAPPGLDSEGVSILALAAQTSAPAGGAPTVWLGTAQGLWRYRDGHRRAWGTSDGLPNASVLALHLQRSGTREWLWVGTEGGLARLDPRAEEPRIASAPDPAVPWLPNPFVYAIVEDSAGRLFVPTNSGVARLTWSDAGEAPDIRLFTTEHGLPLNQGMRGAAQVGPLGRIWIGTAGGIAVIDPAREITETRPKRLRLTVASSVAPGQPLAPEARLVHGEGRLVFHYTLLSFVGETLTAYRTQLVGLETLPTEWTAAGEREISELTPGCYRFLVWARDGMGQEVGPEEVAFTIVPAPWQTLPVRLALVALVLLLFWLVARAWVARHERRERELEARVATRTRELAEVNEQLSRLSRLDTLTGLPNRRQFEVTFEAEWSRSMRTDKPLAVVMLDIDDFKVFNDTQGHPAGDECLRRVGRALADALPREGDLLARLGGEEFAVILPATDAEGARQVAERLREAVDALELPAGAEGTRARVTASCGVAATVATMGVRRHVLVSAADRALYRAKHAGKNRVEVDAGR
jgi:diguanylate cyclase (GGDEF)-like protein